MLLIRTRTGKKNAQRTLYAEKSRMVPSNFPGTHAQQTASFIPPFRSRKCSSRSERGESEEKGTEGRKKSRRNDEEWENERNKQNTYFWNRRKRTQGSDKGITTRRVKRLKRKRDNVNEIPNVASSFPARPVARRNSFSKGATRANRLSKRFDRCLIYTIRGKVEINAYVPKHSLPVRLGDP